jgi:hypothetical protein
MLMKIDYKVVATTVMVFYAMLYLFSLKNNMVFGRDTIQYLNMAYKVQHLEWPLSQRWMPLYGVIIGMVSWFTGSILTAAIIVNLLITLSILWVTNLCLREWYPHNSWALILGNALVLTNREFYYHSLSMMAEQQMLLVFIALLYVITETFKAQHVIVQENIKWLSFLSALGMFTKYNTIVIVLMILALMWTWKQEKHKIKRMLYYLFPIVITYGLWVVYKPGSEVIVTALFIPSFFIGFIDNTHYFWISFLDYFTTPQIAAWFSTYSPIISLMLSLLCVIGFLYFCWYVMKKELLHQPYFLLLAFVFIYVSGFTYIATTTGRFEITIRQLNYPFFVLQFVAIFILVYLQKKPQFFKIGMGMAVLFVMVGGYKMYGRFHAFRNTGYGELAGTNYDVSEYQCLQYAFEYIKRHGIESKNIYTNKHKVLGIHFGFEELKKLPTSLNWRGNHTFYLQGDLFYEAMQQLCDTISANGILIFVGDDFGSKIQLYRSYLDSLMMVVSFSDGFVIHKK